MNYTDIEKQAIIKTLSDLMTIDGTRDIRETQYLRQVKQELGLSDIFSGTTITREDAIKVISRMTDVQKIEVALMLQMMMQADGVQAPEEMLFIGEIVASTGIDKATARKTTGVNIHYDYVKIYLTSTKVALTNRSQELLLMVDRQAANFKRQFSSPYSTIDDMCNLILEYTEEGMHNSGWELDDMDGVAWYIANNTDALIKAGLIKDYDTMFVKCFKQYFNL